VSSDRYRTKDKAANDGDRCDEDASSAGAKQNRVLSSAFSTSGKYFAVCDAQRQLHLFGTGDNGDDNADADADGDETGERLPMETETAWQLISQR
jgi:hypothetical protein